MNRAERKRILAERDQLAAFLAPLGLRLVGWDTPESFAAFDTARRETTDWTPGHVAVLRRALACHAPEAKKEKGNG